MTDLTPDGGRIEVEGDKPKVGRTIRYFTEIRASLLNGADALRDLKAEMARLEKRDSRLETAARTLLSYWEPPERGTKEYDFWEPPDGKTIRRILAEFRAALDTEQT